MEWAYKLLLILVIVGVLSFIILWLIRFTIVGTKAFGGLQKGVIRYFLPSSLISMVASGLCLLVQAPIGVIIIAFLASFIGVTLILLGNDEDNDKFRKL